MLIQASQQKDHFIVPTFKDDIQKHKAETMNTKHRLLAMTEKEKQIPVDPLSLKQVGEEGDHWSLVPPLSTTRSSISSRVYPPLPLPPVKSKFLSSSLPNSATSSPRSGSTLIKNLKKWRNQNQASATTAAISSLARQQSATVSPFASQEIHLQRSKSCGEGRKSAPFDEFDLWSSRRSMAIHDSDDNDDTCCKYEGYHGESKNIQGLEPFDDGFNKCGALCLFLPGFGKGKPVRARKEEVVANVVSRTVSLEKFECGSWASSAIINDEEENGESMRLYFDLPLELIRDSVNEAHSPVTAAFVFERDRKGVLKNNTSRGAAGKPQESSRHVRFSPSCISPRLRKAREDFNAYLEAQGA